MIVTRLIRRARSATTSGLLIALTVSFLAAGSIAAIAIAATSGGPVPPAKPLPQAVHDALAAPKVQGITARITFSNRLIDSSAIQGGDPLLSGGSGRLWLGSGHRFRLELQSDSGDVQVVSDGTTLSVYDPGLDLAYRVALPAGHAASTDAGDAAPPSIAQIETDLSKLSQHADVSPANPVDVAGRPAYEVRVSPSANGGLIGAAELAWDAASGVPLRAALYAKGDATPVLELAATDVSYGPVDASVFDVPAPAGVKVTTIRTAHRAAPRTSRAAHAPVTGLSAVRSAVPFTLSAPDTLAGLSRSGVRLLDMGDKQGAVVTYGTGLGTLAVVELPAQGPAARVGAPKGDGPGLSLPTIDVGGATAQELPTALGTVVRFTRAGVTYVVAGSVSQSVAEAAARGI